MATTSVKIKTPIDISTVLINCSNDFNRAKAMILSRRNELAAIPTTFSDYVTSMQAIDTKDSETSAIDIARKQEFDELVTEFNDLKIDLETALKALGITY